MHKPSLFLFIKASTKTEELVKWAAAKKEVTEIETTPSLSCMDGSSGVTCEQFQELKHHFKIDSNHKEETLEAWADALKLTKWDIKIWFLSRRNEMKLK